MLEWTDATGERVLPLSGVVTIGGGERSTIRLSAPDAPEFACSLYSRAGRWFVRRGETTVAVRINEQPLTEAVLEPGDRLAIGSAHFVFRDPSRPVDREALARHYAEIARLLAEKEREVHLSVSQAADERRQLAEEGLRLADAKAALQQERERLLLAHQRVAAELADQETRLEEERLAFEADRQGWLEEYEARRQRLDAEREALAVSAEQKQQAAEQLAFAERGLAARAAELDRRGQMLAEWEARLGEQRRGLEAARRALRAQRDEDRRRRRLVEQAAALERRRMERALSEARSARLRAEERLGAVAQERNELAEILLQLRRAPAAFHEDAPSKPLLQPPPEDEPPQLLSSAPGEADTIAFVRDGRPSLTEAVRREVDERRLVGWRARLRYDQVEWAAQYDRERQELAAAKVRLNADRQRFYLEQTKLQSELVEDRRSVEKERSKLAHEREQLLELHRRLAGAKAESVRERIAMVEERLALEEARAAAPEANLAPLAARRELLRRDYEQSVGAEMVLMARLREELRRRRGKLTTVARKLHESTVVCRSVKLELEAARSELDAAAVENRGLAAALDAERKRNQEARMELLAEIENLAGLLASGPAEPLETALESAA